MTKVLKLMGLVVVLSGSLFAEMVFNLQEQHFSKAIEGNYENARYDLPDAYITTNLKFKEGVYFSNDSTGKFNIELKQPIENWSVSFDEWFYLYYNIRRFIKFIDDNGESIVISFKENDIHFDDKSVVSNLNKSQRLIIGLTKNENDIELSINGSKVGTATRASFSKLKYIETGLMVANNGDADKLSSLMVGSK